MGNDFNLLRAIVGELSPRFAVAVFGGWAEELLELTPPRRHKDIDLMLYDPDLDELDRFVGIRGEIVAKRFSHKRAFVLDHVLIELFLATRDGERWKTAFWDSHSYFWPQGSDPIIRRHLPVVPAEVVSAFRRDHDLIHAARPTTDGLCG
jgi:hypothetical protein